ncbi:MAG: lysozyme inhibitor LprI family protein [Sphingomonas sp.]
MTRMMKLTDIALHAALLPVALLAVSSAAVAHARNADPFAYSFKMTPEEGPIDPRIDHRYTARWTACQKHASVTRENAACFEAEFVRQDAVLNQVWKRTIARLPTVSRRPLLAAQRQWIAARDPFCRSFSDGFGQGTIAPVAYSNCRVEQTIRRTIWLEQLG